MRWTTLLRVGIRLSIAGIGFTLITRLPLVVLGNTGTVREVALFSAAQRFADAALLLTMTSGLALLPGIADLAQADPGRAKRLLRTVMVSLTVLSVVLAAILFPLAEPVMRTVFGSDYAAGADLLRILLLGFPSYVVLGLCWYSLIAFDGEASLLWIGLTGLVLGSLAAALLIPSGGDDGAAWAYVGALYGIAALTLVALQRRLARLETSSSSAASPQRPCAGRGVGGSRRLVDARVQGRQIGTVGALQPAAPA